MGVLLRSKSVIYGLDSDLATLTAADLTLQGNIDAEEASRISEDGVLDGKITAEKNRAEGVEGSLSLLSTTDKTDLVSAINEVAGNGGAAVSTLSSDLATEEAARIAADGVLQDNIDIEETARIAADNGLSSDIATVAGDLAQEVTDRTNADTTLQSNIDAEKARIDAILAGASANTDTFAEVVTLINSVDTANDQAFAGYVLSNDAAVAQNASDIATNASDIATEISDRIAGDSATLTSANSYTDGEITTLDGLAQGYASTAESNANSYTDGREVAITSAYEAYADTAESDAITSANSYTDGEIATLDAAVAADIDAITVANMSEVLVVSGDNITLTKAALNDVIFNFSCVRHTDATTGVSYDIPVTKVSGSTWLLHGDTAGQFDTKSVMVQYQYNPTI